MMPVEFGGAFPFPYFGNAPKLFLELFVAIVSIFVFVNFDEWELNAVDLSVFGERYVDELEVFPSVGASW